MWRDFVMLLRVSMHQTALVREEVGLLLVSRIIDQFIWCHICLVFLVKVMAVIPAIT